MRRCRDDPSQSRQSRLDGGRGPGCRDRAAGVARAVFLSVAVVLATGTGVAFASAPSRSLPVSSAPSCRETKRGVGHAVRLVRPSVVAIQLSVPGGKTADGTGFVWDRAGHIVTNHHVLAAGANPVVVLRSGKRLTATVIADIPALDVAVITVPDSNANPRPVRLAAEGAHSDQVVLTIGNPFGRGLVPAAGRVTALRHDIVIPPGIPLPGLIETDLPLRPGNSGGPVFDCRGRVLGMAAAVLARAGGSGTASYAIPTSRVDLAVAAAADGQRAGKRSARAPLGIMLVNDAADRLVVAEVAAKAAAAGAGIRAGDILLKANGHALRMVSDLDREMAKLGRHQALVLEILRAGEKITKNIPVSIDRSR